MQKVLSYRHRVITEEDLVFIRKLIAEYSRASRWALSKKLCEAWNWGQANGALCDKVCRGMMLTSHANFVVHTVQLLCTPHGHIGGFKMKAKPLGVKERNAGVAACDFGLYVGQQRWFQSQS